MGPEVQEGSAGRKIDPSLLPGTTPCKPPGKFQNSNSVNSKVCDLTQKNNFRMNQVEISEGIIDEKLFLKNGVFTPKLFPD